MVNVETEVVPAENVVTVADSSYCENSDTNTVSQEVTEEVKMVNVKDDEKEIEHEVEDEMEEIGNVESDDEVINVAKMEPVDDSEMNKINLSQQLENLIKQSRKNRDLWDKIS